MTPSTSCSTTRARITRGSLKTSTNSTTPPSQCNSMLPSQKVASVETNASPCKRVKPKRGRGLTGQRAATSIARANQNEDSAIGDQKQCHFESWLGDQARSLREINVLVFSSDAEEKKRPAGSSSSHQEHSLAGHGDDIANEMSTRTPVSVMDLVNPNEEGYFASARRYPDDLLMPDLETATTDRRSKRDRNSNRAFVALTPRSNVPYDLKTCAEENKVNSGEDDATENDLAGASDPCLLGLPIDILTHVASFLDPLDDRASTARVCHVFHKVMQSSCVLRSVPLLGALEPFYLAQTTAVVSDDEGGFSEKLFADPSVTDMVKCYVREQDVLHPLDVLHRLQPFMEAGNGDALYMAGMIHVYGSSSTSLKKEWSESDHRHVGIQLLRQAATHSHLRSMHSLAIILRDATPLVANMFLVRAHAAGFLPASMEVLSHSELKRHADGDLTSSQLCFQLDSLSLHRLLRTCFVDCSDARADPTSHCWNRHCGRWAYRAGVHFTHNEVSVRERTAPPLTTATRAVGDDSSPGSSTGNIATMNEGAHPASKRPRVAFATTSTGKMTSQAPDEDSNDAATDAGVVQCARMKMCSTCRRAKYCSKLCQIYDWRSGRHKVECRYLATEEFDA